MPVLLLLLLPLGLREYFDTPSSLLPNAPLPGVVTLSGIITLPDKLRHSLTIGPDTKLFAPPMFGVTVLGSSHGFDPKGSTSGYVLWVNRRGVMIDPPPHSSSILEQNQIHPSVIDAVIVTHCHAGRQPVHVCHQDSCGACEVEQA